MESSLVSLLSTDNNHSRHLRGQSRPPRCGGRRSERACHSIDARLLESRYVSGSPRVVHLQRADVVERLGLSEAVRPSSHRSLRSLVVIVVMEVMGSGGFD